MPSYKDLERRKQMIRNYVKSNPYATSREIKNNLHCKIERIYMGGMAEAFRDANVPFPRTFLKKTKNEKRKIIIDYIKANPNAGGQKIRKDTKINYLTVFKNTKEAFEKANLPYPREEKRNLWLRTPEERKQKIIDILKENPLLSIDRIGKKIKAHPYQIFKNAKEIYQKAGIDFINGPRKRKMNKQNLIISYIKDNNFATQRDINRNCRTKVQEIFEGGIFEAYEQAKISFPYERLKIHGAAFKDVKDNANLFEAKIARQLSGFGNVYRLVKTNRGIADIIFERKGKKIAVEIKNYKVHEISISQIKQLNKYMEDINTNLGFLVCLKKPKKDRFLMGKNEIIVLEDSEINKIPLFMDS